MGRTPARTRRGTLAAVARWPQHLRRASLAHRHQRLLQQCASQQAQQAAAPPLEAPTAEPWQAHTRSAPQAPWPGGSSRSGIPVTLDAYRTGGKAVMARLASRRSRCERGRYGPRGWQGGWHWTMACHQRGELV
jgi:hypothetical protein